MGCSSFTIARIINTAIIWASTRETLSSGVCEQHRRRPACASAQSDQRLFIRSLESIICKLAAGEISIFKLVSIAEETGLKHSLSNPSPPPPPENSFFISQTWKKAFFHTTQLTHICLTSFLWGIGKQCRTR